MLAKKKNKKKKNPLLIIGGTMNKANPKETRERSSLSLQFSFLFNKIYKKNIYSSLFFFISLKNLRNLPSFFFFKKKKYFGWLFLFKPKKGFQPPLLFLFKEGYKGPFQGDKALNSLSQKKKKPNLLSLDITLPIPKKTYSQPILIFPNFSKLRFKKERSYKGLEDIFKNIKNIKYTPKIKENRRLLIKIFFFYFIYPLKEKLGWGSKNKNKKRNIYIKKSKKRIDKKNIKKYNYLNIENIPSRNDLSKLISELPNGNALTLSRKEKRIEFFE